MRSAVAGVLFACLLSPAAFAAPTADAKDAARMANTPSGMTGDPDTIVCRASQRLSGADQSGPEVCRRNSEWWSLTMRGKDLAPDGKALIDRPTVANPTGEGDPDAVTCRAPKSAMRGPVCQTNHFWAILIKNHQTVDGPTVDNPTGEGDPDGVTCRTPKFVSHGPLVEVCDTNRFWADAIKNHPHVAARDEVMGPLHQPVDYGQLYGPGGNNGNWNNFGNRSGSGLSGDSGYASQSSANGGGGGGAAYGGYHP
ncbi:MAG: hypothetical protein ACXWLT_05895 [Rhizomicrobium sp.]